MLKCALRASARGRWPARRSSTRHRAANRYCRAAASGVKNADRADESVAV